MSVEPTRGRWPARLFAVGVAAALVVGAVLVRGRLDDGAGGGGGDGPRRIVCTTELEAACRALAEQGARVTVEDAGATAERILAAEGAALDFDGWLAPEPWPTIVRDTLAREGRAEVLGAPTEPVARSPLVLVVRRDRAAVLGPRCEGGEVGWRCLGDAAGAPWAELGGSETWGRVKPAHGDPQRSAEGVLALGQASAAYLATPDRPPAAISRIDFETDDGFLDWLRRLETAVPAGGFDPPAGSPFQQLLQTRLASADAVAALEAEVGPAVARNPAVAAEVEVLYPAPVATADVVLAPVRDAAGADALADLVTGAPGRAALAAAGWRVDGEPVRPGVGGGPALPTDGNGLPAAGVLEALQELWGEIVR